MDFSYLTEHYWLAAFLFQRGLGVIYIIGFLVAINQFRPLLGEQGIEPVPAFLDRVKQATGDGWRAFLRLPSIFHLHYSDRFFAFVAWSGLVLSIVATLGIADIGPVWLSVLVWFLLWAMYLSIINVGQTFYGFGWESMLVEAGFLAIFLGPLTISTPLLAIFLIRWMLFRVEFGAGLIKIRGDRCWRDLTCLEYHHETQPMPNPVSWFAHHMPRWWHKLETFGNHVVQLGVIWLIFLPQPIATVAGIIIILTQLWLVVSGNFSWLNWLTIVLAFTTLSDGMLQAVFGWSANATATVIGVSVGAQPIWFGVLVILAATLVALLSIEPVKNLLSRGQLMNASFNPLHLVNTYGAFGHVTKKRYEIVVQGTNDDPNDPTAEWHTYLFKGKPTDPAARPPQWAPYHLRLDWQMWFAAMGPYYTNPWFVVFIKKVLQGQSDVITLLHHSPFGYDAPRYIRAQWYLYRFTTPEEKRETGRWWHREYIDEYLPPISRRDIEDIV